MLYTVTAVLRSGEMFSWYSNKQMDELIDAAKQTVDPKKHEDYLHRLLRLMSDDPPFGYLYNQRDIYGVNKRLFGNRVPMRISISTEPL